MTAPQRAVITRLPASPGVYRFRDERGRALYIGRAVELRRRVASYWSDLRGRRHLRTMVARIERIEAVSCDSDHEAAWLERNLLERAKPTWNRTRGGQEVPVYLQLDSRPTAPGLRMVHQVHGEGPLRHFGPYLGGTKVRLAVAALHRVWPLSYAAATLRGAERDLAAQLGVRPEHRDELLRSLTDLLERDPATVLAATDGLRGRQDRAVEELAFEFAGRLQEEIVALRWLTAIQRVTQPGPDDADVYGWADGILVGFQIRAGRMSTWTQKACTRTEAAARLERTPPGWTEFAQRNADLAAHLAG